MTLPSHGTSISENGGVGAPLAWIGAAYERLWVGREGPIIDPQSDYAGSGLLAYAYTWVELGAKPWLAR